MPEPNAQEAIEIDPLLEFSTERSESAPSPSPVDPVAETAVPAKDNPVVEADDRHGALQSRVEVLERSLDETRQQFSTLTSEVATLVRVADDIKRRMAKRDASPAVPPLPRQSKAVPYKFLSAITGVLVGVAAGVLIWTKLAGVQPPPAVSPEPARVEAPADPPPSAPAPQPVAVPVAAVVPAAVTPARDQRVSPAEPRVVNYTGTLSIDSDPGGNVFINRQPAGHTPVRVPNLRAGAHLVWIERDGYRRWTRVVEVPADRVTRLSASLESLSAR